MNQIILEELYYTYRKVKRELFNNKDLIYFTKILEYEKNLDKNLQNLLNLLHGSIEEFQKTN